MLQENPLDLFQVVCSVNYPSLVNKGNGWWRNKPSLL